MGRQSFYSKFFDFAGGQNDTASVVKVAPNEGDRFWNVDLDRDGAVSKRKGAKKQNSTPTGAGHEFGMVLHFKPSADTDKVLVAYDQDIAEWTGSAFSTLLTGLTANKVVLGVPFKNLCYFNNGVDVPLVYYPDKPGTPRVVRSGTPVPTGTVTQGADVAGSLTATNKFLVRIRFVSAIDPSLVSEPFPADGVEIEVGASGGRTLTNIPVYTPSGIDHAVVDRVVERTSAGPSPGGTFYEDGRLGDNVTTVYDVTQTDGFLFENDIAPAQGARAIPPKLFPFLAYKNRIVGYDPSVFGKIVWSEIDEFGILPEAIPTLNFQYLDVQDFRDAPKAMAVLGEYVIVYCGRSIHLLYIDANNESYARRIATHDLGVPSARAVAELPNAHIFWSYRGPYIFDGQNLIYIGERIEEAIESIPKVGLTGIWSLHLPQEKRRQVKFFFPFENNSECDYSAVYHYARPSLNSQGFTTQHAWTFHKGFLAKAGGIVQDSNNTLLEYTGDYDGTLYLQDIGDTDEHLASGAIDAVVRTAWLDMDVPEAVKEFTDLWVLLSGDVGQTITVSWETEFGNGPSGGAVLSLSEAQSQFGTALFGTATFGGGETVIRHSQIAQNGVTALGKWIRFSFSSTQASQPFTLFGFVVKWDAERDRNDPID